MPQMERRRGQVAAKHLSRFERTPDFPKIMMYGASRSASPLETAEGAAELGQHSLDEWQSRLPALSEHFESSF